MKRILQIVYSMNRGGIETFLMNIYRKIDRSALQFDFLVHTEEKGDYDDEIVQMGGRVFSVPSRRAGVFNNKKSLTNFFKQHSEYSVVHQHTSSLSYIAPLIAAKKCEIPTRIIHAHSSRQEGSKLHYLFHALNKKRIGGIASKYFSCSTQAAKWFYSDKIRASEEYAIIKNSIDIAEFSYNPDVRAKKRSHLGLESSFVIGHVGRFSPAKNHKFLVDVFSQLLKIKENAKLLLVGEGETMKAIHEMVHELGINDNVIFAGLQSDVSSWLQAMDVFVLPSVYEGLPVTLIEAQASGLPCLISNTVTDDVMVTRLIKKLSLTAPIEEWANRVIQLSSSERNGKQADVRRAGLDSNDVAGKLMEFYLN